MDKAERNRRMFDAYQGGAKLREVASANGLSRPGAFRALQRESRRREMPLRGQIYGLGPRAGAGRPRKAVPAWAAEAYRARATPDEEIAAAAGMSVKILRREMRLAGVLRKRGQRPKEQPR